MQVVDDAWGTPNPRGLGLLMALGHLPFASAESLWCPGFEIDPNAVDASRYRGYIERMKTGTFGPSGFHDYSWVPHAYRARSAATDDCRLDGNRLARNPQILTDAGFALNNLIYWQGWPTYCGGRPHGLTGTNTGFVDGHVAWLSWANLQRNTRRHYSLGHLAHNLTRDSFWINWTQGDF
jgi:prepilin-type processing-associated H-X9-DG protein